MNLQETFNNVYNEYLKKYNEIDSFRMSRDFMFYVACKQTNKEFLLKNLYEDFDCIKYDIDMSNINFRELIYFLSPQTKKIISS